MKILWKINIVINVWLLLFFATSNMLAIRYESFDHVNLVASITLLAIIAVCNLVTLIFQISSRLSRINNFSKLLRR